MLARGPRALMSVIAVLIVGALTSAFAFWPSANAQGATAAATPQLGTVLAGLAGGDLPALPPVEMFKPGTVSIAAGTRVDGPVAASDGTVDVYGTVTGDVVSFRGDNGKSWIRSKV